MPATKRGKTSTKLGASPGLYLGLQDEQRARLGESGPTGEYLTPAGFQRAQSLPQLDRTRRPQDGDRIGPKVVQVRNLDHLVRSRITGPLQEWDVSD